MYTIYKSNELSKDIKEHALSILHNDKTGGLTFSDAVCRILSGKHCIQYVCYGGTPVMPISEYRRMPGAIKRQY